jgi:hypothetical protein
MIGKDEMLERLARFEDDYTRSREAEPPTIFDPSCFASLVGKSCLNLDGQRIGEVTGIERVDDGAWATITFCEDDEDCEPTNRKAKRLRCKATRRERFANIKTGRAYARLGRRIQRALEHQP